MKTEEELAEQLLNYFLSLHKKCGVDCSSADKGWALEGDVVREFSFFNDEKKELLKLGYITSWSGTSGSYYKLTKKARELLSIIDL